MPMPDPSRIARGLYWSKSWRVVNGCTRVSPGCVHCWSEAETNMRGSNPAVAYRYAKDKVLADGRWNGRVMLAPERVLTEPLRTKKPQVWAIWSDLFHEGISCRQVDRVLEVIEDCPQHTFLALTKRPENIQRKLYATNEGCPVRVLGGGDYLNNLWLGVTAENQDMADLRIPALLQIPAALHFVSAEPMLGPLNLEKYLSRYIQPIPTATMYPPLSWVICGQENGPGARQMHPDWARSLRDQCQTKGVPFFFKQWGEFIHTSQMPDWLYREFDACHPGESGFCRVGKKSAGCLLDGKEWKQFPEVK